MEGVEPSIINHYEHREIQFTRFSYSMEDKSYEFVSDNEDKELSVCFFKKEYTL